ncbi:hypothetical protein [Lignipirellula cremea]|uniref:Uncharacterized protein n=1 Tax=Lignipirellula cremea TaxID=2528010 RepID=A0A518E3F4_9BACT|nr:hypothetical protein [Lignipirellula cremea]QDU98620.1 hypothetical protein Pla8534_64910 [Lignipirellula cremea]
MNDLYHEMLSNAPLTRIMQQAVETNKFALKTAAQALTDEDITRLGVLTSQKLRVGGVESILASGCLLSLFRTATDADDRRELFENLLKDLDMSQTQAYRCESTWNCFGLALVREPQLAKYFVAESLKILSADSVPTSVRESALQRTRKGEKITIKSAKALLGRGARVRAGQAKANSAKATRRMSDGSGAGGCLWSYVGEAIRLTVEPRQADAQADKAAIIRDLEAAINQLRAVDSGDPNIA